MRLLLAVAPVCDNQNDCPVSLTSRIGRKAQIAQSIAAEATQVVAETGYFHRRALDATMAPALPVQAQDTLHTPWAGAILSLH